MIMSLQIMGIKRHDDETMGTTQLTEDPYSIFKQFIDLRQTHSGLFLDSIENNALMVSKTSKNLLLHN